MWVMERLATLLLNNNSLQTVHLGNNALSPGAISRIRWLMSLQNVNDRPLQLKGKEEMPVKTEEQPPVVEADDDAAGADSPMKAKDDDALEFDEKDRVKNPYMPESPQRKLGAYNMAELEVIKSKVAKETRCSPLNSPGAQRGGISKA